jgi:hypothetical protein
MLVADKVSDDAWATMFAISVLCFYGVYLNINSSQIFSVVFNTLTKTVCGYLARAHRLCRIVYDFSGNKTDNLGSNGNLTFINISPSIYDRRRVSPDFRNTVNAKEDT